MKKFPFLICLMILAGCSKNEVLSPLDNLSSSSSDITVSHLNNDDLVLTNGLIQLKISKEEAVNRGVPASEYDLVESTITRHNKAKSTVTKSVNRQTLAWGMLQDPPGAGLTNSINGLNVNSTYGGIVLDYTFGSEDTDYCTLYYNLYGSESFMDSVSGLGKTQGSVSFSDFSWGYINLSFVLWSGTTAICIYEVKEQ